LRIATETVGVTPITFGYDADGLLLAAGDLTLSRDAQTGFLLGSTLGANTDTWAYNTYGAAATYSLVTGSATAFSQQFTRNEIGLVTQQRQTILGDTHTFDYSYDRSGRLRTVLKDGVPAATYTFDENGNRLIKLPPAGTDVATYDAQDRVLSYADTTFSYTPNGDLASMTGPLGSTSYTYDELGDLTSVTLPNGSIVSYIIDGEHRRVGKRMNGVLLQQWIYDGQLRIAAELDSTGAVVSRFVYATHSNVPDYMIRDGLVYRIVTDHLGSPRLVIESQAGTVVERIDYDEYGNVLPIRCPASFLAASPEGCTTPRRASCILARGTISPKCGAG
jgi:YD repeat-containing protein